MGLGLLGRGVGDVEFLAKCGAQVLVTDRKSEEELAGSVARLQQYPNVTFKLGAHDESDFTSCDMVMKAAGVPIDSPYIAAARKAHVPVVMSTALFAKYAMEIGATIVGVTGTRGKSTVTNMIYHALVHDGRSALLGGNVRGISTLAMLPDMKAGDIAVLELDSWQLQGFRDLQISPHVAVFTNLMPDHQNYYSDMDEYLDDKANIYRFQKPGDTLVLGGDMVRQIKVTPPVNPVIPDTLAPDWSLKIPGQHNRHNAALAAAALLALGMMADKIREGLETFEGVEGRLQLVREWNGIRIYNDNNATTPEATVAGLRALDRDITLICGGSEKDLPLDELVTEIRKRVSALIVLTHANYKGSARLKQDLRNADIPFVEADSLKKAVDTAAKETKTGSILFSPAFASFGMFQNEYERNDEFMRLIKGL